MNAGQMRIAEELLLDWFKFEGGHVLGCKWDYVTNTLILVISHPDMPEVKEGEAYPQISPSYRKVELLGFKYERIV